MTGLIELEDGSGTILLEDGSGSIALESISPWTVFDSDAANGQAVTAFNVYSNGNLTCALQGSIEHVWKFTQSVDGATSGLLQFSFTIVAGPTDGTISLGVINSLGCADVVLGGDNNGFGYTSSGVTNYQGGYGPTWATYTVGDTVTFYVQISNTGVSLLWSQVNTGAYQGSGAGANPGTGTAGVDISAICPAATRLYPVVMAGSAATTITANFGGAAFPNATPSGFTAGWPISSSLASWGSLATNGYGQAYQSISGPTYLEASQYVCTLGGPVASITIPFAAAGTDIVAGVFADAGGYPGALIAQTAPMSPAGPGEVTQSISGLTGVEGDRYWVALYTSGSAATVNAAGVTNTAVVSTPSQATGTWYAGQDTLVSVSNTYPSVVSTYPNNAVQNAFRVPVLFNLPGATIVSGAATMTGAGALVGASTSGLFATGAALMAGQGQAFFAPQSYTRIVSLFPPPDQTSIQNAIKAYVYTQYNDDFDIVSIFAAYNAYLQGYINWFNNIELPIYTNGSVVGALLDWVGTNLYGLRRPSLPSRGTSPKGPNNTYALNTIPINGHKAGLSDSYYNTSDDIYKRIITWKFYKADGRQFSIPWLKRRIMRFLYGVNGTDYNIDETYPVSVVFTAPYAATITLTSTPITIIFAAAVAAGILDLPFLIAWTVTLV